MKRKTALVCVFLVFALSTPARAEITGLKDTATFFKHAWQRYKGEVVEGSACESVGTYDFQKKHFIEKHGLSQALINCDLTEFNSQKKQILEKSLGLSQREFGRLQRDAALLVLAKDYAARVDKNRELAKKIGSEFKTFIKAGFDGEAAPLSADSVQIALDTQSVLSGLDSIVKKSREKGTKCCDELSNNVDVRRVASVSPVVAVKLKEALELVARSPNGVAVNEIAVLCQQAAEAMDVHTTKEQIETQALINNLKKNSDNLPLSEQSAVEEMRRKFVKKLVHGNPITAAAIIEGIQPNGKYVPTEFEVLSKSLCELDSIEYEMQSHEVQDEFFVNAGMSLIPFSKVGALALGAHAILAARDSDKLMDQCLDMQKDFNGDLAVEAGLSLRDQDQKAALAHLASAQTSAVNSCVTSAKLNRAMSFANAGLAVLGLGGIARGASSPANKAAITTITKWAGRAVAGSSTALAGYDTFEACTGEVENADAKERCRVAKANLAQASVLLVGNEMLHRQNREKPPVLKNKGLPPTNDEQVSSKQQNVEVVRFEKKVKVIQPLSEDTFRAGYGADKVRKLSDGKNIVLPKDTAIFLVPNEDGTFRTVTGKATQVLSDKNKVFIRSEKGALLTADPRKVLVAEVPSPGKLVTWENPEKASGIARVIKRSSENLQEFEAKYADKNVMPMWIGGDGMRDAIRLTPLPPGDSVFGVNGPDGVFREVRGVAKNSAKFGEIQITPSDGGAPISVDRRNAWALTEKVEIVKPTTIPPKVELVEAGARVFQGRVAESVDDFRAKYPDKIVSPLMIGGDSPRSAFVFPEVPKSESIYGYYDSNGVFREVSGIANAIESIGKVQIKPSSGAEPIVVDRKQVWVLKDKTTVPRRVTEVLSLPKVDEGGQILNSSSVNSVEEFQKKYGAEKVAPLVVGGSDIKNAVVYNKVPHETTTFLVRHADNSFEELRGVARELKPFGDVEIVTVDPNTGKKRIMKLAREDVWYRR